MKLMKNKINKRKFSLFFVFLVLFPQLNQQLFDGDCYTTKSFGGEVKKERQQQTKVDYFGGCTNDASYVR